MIAIVIAVDIIINAMLAAVIIIIIATVIIIFPQLAIVIAVIINIAMHCHRRYWHVRMLIVTMQSNNLHDCMS